MSILYTNPYATAIPLPPGSTAAATNDTLCQALHSSCGALSSGAGDESLDLTCQSAKTGFIVTELDLDSAHTRVLGALSFEL